MKDKIVVGKEKKGNENEDDRNVRESELEGREEKSSQD